MHVTSLYQFIIMLNIMHGSTARACIQSVSTTNPVHPMIIGIINLYNTGIQPAISIRIGQLRAFRAQLHGVTFSTRIRRPRRLRLSR